MKPLLPALVGSFVFATLPLIGVSSASAGPTLSQPRPQGGINLTVSARSPAYTLNSLACANGGGAITFHLTVSNTGAFASPVIRWNGNSFFNLYGNPNFNGGQGLVAAMGGGSTTWGGWTWDWVGWEAVPAVAAHSSVPIDVTIKPPSGFMSHYQSIGGQYGYLSNIVTDALPKQSVSGFEGSVIIPKGFCNPILVHPLTKP
jgi:hypothetical protein